MEKNRVTLGRICGKKFGNFYSSLGDYRLYLLKTKFDQIPGTDKNEPGRFLGEGVSFRAKLIGVLEVPEARGDRMCQEALADLKMAIRAAGEHKQRIQVHVAIDGLRLRDDKTGVSLVTSLYRPLQIDRLFFVHTRFT